MDNKKAQEKEVLEEVLGGMAKEKPKPSIRKTPYVIANDAGHGILKIDCHPREPKVRITFPRKEMSWQFDLNRSERIARAILERVEELRREERKKCES